MEVLFIQSYGWVYGGAVYSVLWVGVWRCCLFSPMGGCMEVLFIQSFGWVYGGAVRCFCKLFILKKILFWLEDV